MGFIPSVEAHPVRVVERVRAGERRRHRLGIVKTERKRLHRGPELVRSARAPGEGDHRLSGIGELPGDVLAGVPKRAGNGVHGRPTWAFLPFARCGRRAFSPSERNRSTWSKVATIPSNVWKKRSIASSLFS